MSTTDVESPHSRAFRTASAVGFLLLGAAVSLYGPAVPLLRDRFAISTASAGSVLPVHAIASVIGVLAWGAFDRAAHVRRALVGGAFCIAVGAVGLALAPTYALVLVSAGAIGFGFGTLDTGTNALFARDRTPGAAARMNSLHAMFGVGAVSAPLLLSVTSLGVAFGVVAALMALAIPAFRHARDPGVLDPTDGSPGARRAARVVLGGFLLMFALYIGLELGVGNWMAVHLTDQGWSSAAAARWTSGYFLAFTIGRVLVARFASHRDPAVVVMAALSSGTACVLVAVVAGLTPYAYVLTGLAIAPVFPTAMIWLSRRLPESRHAPAAAMLSGSVGAAVLPAVVGGAVGVGGTDVVPYAVAATGVLATLAAVWVRRAATAR